MYMDDIPDWLWYSIENEVFMSLNQFLYVHVRGEIYINRYTRLSTEADCR